MLKQDLGRCLETWNTNQNKFLIFSANCNIQHTVRCGWRGGKREEDGLEEEGGLLEKASTRIA